MENLKIRMILCDVDGTLLLKNEQNVSNRVFHAIKEAVSHDINFVVASGRPYCDLKKLFLPVSDLITFISSDGALTVKNDKIESAFPIDKSIIDRFVPFVDYEKLVLYSNDDFVFKIAFKNLSIFEKEKVKSIAKNTGKLKEIYSDSIWTEFISLKTDKGKAAKYLQKKLGFCELETAAFGDNTNDFEMLRCASLTYSSPCAIPEIKQMCKYETKDIAGEILKLAGER